MGQLSETGALKLARRNLPMVDRVMQYRDSTTRSSRVLFAGDERLALTTATKQ
jgi:hypothetical protein